MDITPVIHKGRQVIEAYGNESFTISGAAFKGTVLILGDSTLPLSLAKADALTVEILEPLWQADVLPELLLIGTGKTPQPISPAVRQALRATGVALEAMDTGAACRTYNVLMAEGRRVAAALVAV